MQLSLCWPSSTPTAPINDLRPQTAHVCRNGFVLVQGLGSRVLRNGSSWSMANETADNTVACLHFPAHHF